MPFPSLDLNLHEQVGALPVTADVPSGGHTMSGRSFRAPL